MDDWKKIIGAGAPTIATALGGPLAGMATKAIAGAILGDENASEKDLAAAITGASPDQLAALKKVDADFQSRMKELDVDLERIAMQDRDSARRREAAVKDWMPKVLATIVVAGFLGTVFMVLGGYVHGLRDPMMATTVGTLIGYVSSKADQIVGYYFGSSASSARKTDLLESQTAKK
jgi:hypothetical protein